MWQTWHTCSLGATTACIDKSMAPWPVEDNKDYKKKHKDLGIIIFIFIIIIIIIMSHHEKDSPIGFSRKAFRLKWVPSGFCGSFERHRAIHQRWPEIPLLGGSMHPHQCKMLVHQNKNSLSSWWLNQPILKNMLVKLDHFPTNRDEKKIFENHHLAAVQSDLLYCRFPIYI